jgi:hypothetical protein
MAGKFTRYMKEAFRQMDEPKLHPTLPEIAGYVRGKPDYRLAAVEGHLAQCSECRERADEFGRRIRSGSFKPRARDGEDGGAARDHCGFAGPGAAMYRCKHSRRAELLGDRGARLQSFSGD